MACWWHFCYSKLSQLAGSSLSTSFAEILVLLTWEWNVYRAIPTCNEWVYFWRLIPIFSPVQFRLLKQRGSGDSVSPSAQGESSKFSRSSLEFIQSQFSLICLLLLWKWHLFKFTLFIMADTLFVCLFTPSPSSNCLLQIICDFFFPLQFLTELLGVAVIFYFFSSALQLHFEEQMRSLDATCASTNVLRKWKGFGGCGTPAITHQTVICTSMGTHVYTSIL